MNPVIDIQNLTKSVGDRLLFADVCLGIGEGGHVGLIAKNGTGKSTLLNIICGRDEADSGEVIFRRGITVGMLEQTPVFEPGATVLEAVKSRLSRETAASVMFSDEGQTLQSPYIDSGDIDYETAAAVELRARQVLSKLHIHDFDRPVSLLSGGQQKRVALASVLIADPDLLILDEPTNHLDIEMTEWLEKYLKRSTKALLLVTHDRYFLERTCTDIAELDDLTLYTYHGNYSYYLAKREERIAAETANIARAQNLYRKELEWMRRMPQARGHKSRSRKEAFYELERLARQRTEERLARLEVKSGYIGSKIFEAEYVSKAFDDGPVILKDFYYNFSRYEKMGIVGRNGTGKTTFIKMLLGEIRPDEGRFVIGETVRFGYFSQETDAFDTQMKVIDAVRRIAETIDLGGGRRMTAMQFLTHFLFPPARQQDYIYKLSGGERRRLQLCTVLMQNPNFLILDEPTNDLDIATLQVLEAYLADFRGCVIVVSHDRYFMDKVVDHLLVFKGEGAVDDFPGNYTQYREWQELSAQEEQPKTQDTKSNTKESNTKKPVHEGSDRRRRMTFKEKQEFATLTKTIEALEAEKRDLEAALCSGTLAVEDITKYGKRLPALEEELDNLSMRWLELSEIE